MIVTSEKVKLIESIVTWQGEGPDAGKRMLLCRFKKCNRGDKSTTSPYIPPCKYCDTLVKMRSSVETEYYLRDLQKIIDNEKLGLLITGGEPGFDENAKSTTTLVQKLKIPSVINIETNGCNLNSFTYELSFRKHNNNNNVNFIYSPKFFNDVELKNEIDNIEKVVSSGQSENVYIKLVYNNELTELNDQYLDIILDYFDHQKVYLMPEGKTKDELISNSPIVFDKCEEFKVNFSSRQHIIYSFI